MRITSYSLLLDRNSRIPQLVRESSSNFPGVQSLNTPGNIYDMLCHVFHMDQLPEEHLMLISLDSKNHLLGIFEISHGNATQSAAGAREIFVRLLLSGAVNFIIVHNHPSGDASPSGTDQALTDSLMQQNLVGRFPWQKQMEREVKAIIQQYMSRMTQDRLQP